MHLRHSVFVVVGPVLTIAATILAATSTYPSVATHANVANVVNASAAVVAPAFAGFAAWDGLRERRHGGGPLLDTAPRTPAVIHLAQLAAGLTFVVASQVFTITTVYATLGGRELSGEPLWVNLGVSVSAVVLAATWGYAMAALVRHWTAVLAAALPPAVVFGYAALGGGKGVLRDMLPFGDRAGTDFLQANVPFFVGQLVALVGMVALVIGGSAMASRFDRKLGAALLSLGMVVTGVGVGTVAEQHGRWATPVADVSDQWIVLASPGDDVRLHVLPPYLSVQDDLLARWARLRRLLQATPLAFTEVWQISDSHPPPSADTGPLRRVYLNPSSPTIGVDSVLESLVDLHDEACQQGGTFETALVEMWLAGDGAEATSSLRPEHARALAGLRALSTTEGQAWFASNFDAFVGCTVGLDQLPVTS